MFKLEPERGVQFAIPNSDGTYTVELELLRSLTLTDKTKVHKTALLRCEDATVTGWVADDQRTTATGSAVATFFLSRFLGCTALHDDLHRRKPHARRRRVMRSKRPSRSPTTSPATNPYV